MTHEALEQFRSAMQQRGLTPPPSLIADGAIHRCDVAGRKGKLDGAYKLHLDDFPAGGFENHTDGQYWENWKFEGQMKQLTTAERAERKRKIEASNAKREADQLQAYEQAASKALAYWQSLPKTGESLYLQRKQVAAHKLRFDVDKLIIPLCDATGKLWSLQSIQADGAKRFYSGGKVRGCYHTIGQLKGATKAWIAEGYATAATVHMATGLPVIVAFNASNLLPVTDAIKSAYPSLEIMIAADDDKWPKEQTGKVFYTGELKAKEIAARHGCEWLTPKFDPAHDAVKPTDFNDLHCLQGLEEVKQQLQQYARAGEAQADATIIAKLAELPPLDYARQSKEVAKQMGVTKGDIDKAVKEHKSQAKMSKIASSQMFPPVEPWPQAVEGEALLLELSDTFKRYAILPNHSDTALALWVVFTWCIDAVKIAPILAISSPEKQCGKTTVLSLVSQLVYKPLPTANISPAALFRGIELWQPTMLIDEADTFLREAEELRGVINSGHTRPTAFVIRTTGDDHEPTRFSTWGAKAIALIGKLPETLHDRSIVVELRRKLAGEVTQKLRYCDDDLFIPLRRKLQRFANDYRDDLKHMRPTLPNDVSDRAADNWEPLLAIANLAGGGWPDKAMQAAQALSARVNAAASLGTELLGDIETLFQTKGYERFSSKELIEALCEDEERPWLTYNRGRVIAPRQIARLLGEYGIHSKNIKFGFDSVAKGYEKSQFEDAFTRYLSFSPSPPETIRYPLPAAQTLASEVADKKPTNATRYLNATEEPKQTAGCSGRTDNLGVLESKEERVEFEL